MASVGPDDVVSNLSQWVGLLFDPPAWLRAPLVDTWLLIGSVLVVLGSALWFFWPLILRQRQSFGQTARQFAENPGDARKPDRWVPINEAVAHVARVLRDTDTEKCFPRTLNALRQEAADGQLRMRGRKEKDTPAQSTTFSDIQTEVPSTYWATSVIGAFATDKRHADQTHTNPETVYAWGEQGIYERNRYADLHVEWNDIKRLWPSTV